MKTVGNGRKTLKLFSTFTFEIRKQIQKRKVGHKNEHELTKYREFRKRTNSSGFMSNMKTYVLNSELRSRCLAFYKS